MLAWIDLALETIARHAQWADALLFIGAFLETLPLVGFFVPGTALFIGAGMLVGAGIVGTALVLGGIAGEALSYWMGRKSAGWVVNTRLVRRRAAQFARIEDMTRRHAAKAVFLARFIGQIRPIVPFVAGVVRMNPWAFLLYDVLSGVFSVAAHVGVGVALGLGLAVTGAIATRLVVVLLIAVASLWLTQFIARRALRLVLVEGPHVLRRARSWARAAAAASDPRRWLAHGLLYLIEPQYRGLLTIALLGAAALASFAGLVQLTGDVAEGDIIADTNVAVFRFMNALRTEGVDQVAAVIATLGDVPVLLAAAAVVALAIGLWRTWWLSAYWGIAVGFAFASSALIRWLVDVINPAELGGAAPNIGFANGHIASSLVVLGYLAILIVQGEIGARWKATVVALAFLLVSASGLAQVYLGTLYVSGLASGLLLGVFWLILLTVATRARIAVRPALWSASLAGAAFAVLVASTTLYATVLHDRQMLRFSPPMTEIAIAETLWRDGGWRELPAYRVDFGGEPEEPLNVQIAGSLADVAAALDDAGWRAPPTWGFIPAIKLVTAVPPRSGEVRPVLPRLFYGKRTVLTRIKASGGERFIVRLWDIGYRLTPGSLPLFIGTVEREAYGGPHMFDLVSLPPKAVGFGDAAQRLAHDLDGKLALWTRGPAWQPARPDDKPLPWNGATLVTMIGL